MITIVYRNGEIINKVYCADKVVAKMQRALRDSGYFIENSYPTTPEEMKALTITTTKPVNVIGRAQIKALTNRVESRFYNKRG